VPSTCITFSGARRRQSSWALRGPHLADDPKRVLVVTLHHVLLPAAKSQCIELAELYVAHVKAIASVRIEAVVLFTEIIKGTRGLAYHGTGERRQSPFRGRATCQLDERTAMTITLKLSEDQARERS